MRAEGEKLSSSFSVPGKSERSVWAVKAFKVKYAQIFWHTSSCSGQRDLWGATSSGRSVIQACHCPLWLEPAALAQLWWGARSDASSLCHPLLHVQTLLMGPHSLLRSSFWQLRLGKARTWLNLCVRPLCQCCRWACRTLLRNIIVDWKL